MIFSLLSQRHLWAGGAILGAVLICSVAITNGKTPAAPRNFDLVLDGQVDEHMLDIVQKYVQTESPKKSFSVWLRSTGGDAAIGIKIGNLLMKYRPIFHVYGYCNSACAQYIIPSGSKVFLEDRAVVVFHSSPADIPIEALKFPLAQNEKLTFEKNEKAYYQAVGADYSVYRNLGAQRELVCSNPVSGGPTYSINGFEVGYLFAGVVPSREILARMKFPEIVGYWPSSSEEAVFAARNVGFNENFNLKYVNSFEEYIYKGGKCR